MKLLIASIFFILGMFFISAIAAGLIESIAPLIGVKSTVVLCCLIFTPLGALIGHMTGLIAESK